MQLDNFQCGLDFNLDFICKAVHPWHPCSSEYSGLQELCSIRFAYGRVNISACKAADECYTLDSNVLTFQHALGHLAYALKKKM